MVDYRIRMEWERNKKQRIADEQRDIREAREDRIRLTPKYQKENPSPARPAACLSCGHRHKGDMSQSEELRTLWCRARMTWTYVPYMAFDDVRKLPIRR